MVKFRLSNKKDLEEIERVPIQDRLPYSNTFDLLKYGVSINPDAKAISFISSGDNFHEPRSVTYGALLKRVIQTANLFHDLGLRKDDVISVLLPNLLEIQYIMWGGQAAGIVNPINYFLEPSSDPRSMPVGENERYWSSREMSLSASDLGIAAKALEIRKHLPDLERDSRDQWTRRREKRDLQLS